MSVSKTARIARRTRPVLAWLRVSPEVKGAIALLTRRERFIALGLIASTFVNAMLNMAGIASIYPVIQLVLDPQFIDHHARIAGWLARVGVSGTDPTLVLFGAVAMSLIVLKNVYGLFHAYLLNRFCARAGARAATSLLQDIVHAPYEWLAAQNASVLRDVVLLHVDSWARSILRSGLQLATDVMFLAFSVGVIIASAPIAGLLVSLIAIGIAVTTTGLVRPMVMRAAEIKRQAVKRTGVIVTESISGGRDVRISGAGDYLLRNFVNDLERFSKADIRGRVLQMVPRLWIEIIGFGALIGFFLAAVWTGADRTQIASLVALYGLITLRAIPAITQVATSSAVIQSGLLSVDEIMMIKRQVPRFQPRRLPVPAETALKNWTTLTLEGVIFRYKSGSGAVIGPVDLRIERGRSIGIVGASGSGKSTLADLLCGLLEPSAGRLLLDEAGLQGDRLARWRNRIGFVAQTPYLLDGSLQENICFGAVADGVSDKRLAAAVQASGLGAFVDSLPDGLRTAVGDRGVMLSGGQRQRVAIARALYRNADVLILDEATSALDSITEREVHAAINSLKGIVTLIVIAHRLSTVTECDEIFVLDQGRIVEHGSHQELLVISEHYRQMAELQSLGT